MRTFLPVCLISLTAALPALADHRYDEAYRGYVGAAYSHLASAYACRALLGRSHYEDARITAENSLRLSGMPTDIALRSVEKMLEKIRRDDKRGPQLSYAQCATKAATTRAELQRWEKKLLSHKFKDQVVGDDLPDTHLDTNGHQVR
ncbi:hypothetical protein [Rhizobium phaseoli]|uniref:hypothetical protein n=1 Tax=Rhizobium phaseoli TaxID=396 RepID=UPI002553C840|nr:hypothetical protein [Rhizobium phaseoli]MDK4724951.1 hypothetical protein [Rhizobium phaseoli]